VLDAFGPLSAAGEGLLAVAVDLRGWSAGAGVVLATEDQDGDGWGDPADCAPADATAYRPPGPVQDLSLSPAGAGPNILLRWVGSASLAGPGTVHDVLAGALKDLRESLPFERIDCAATGLSADETELAEPSPPPGDGRWYLVRGRNACGLGTTGEGWGRQALDDVVCSSP
jgi:hypothetical protein